MVRCEKMVGRDFLSTFCCLCTWTCQILSLVLNSPINILLIDFPFAQVATFVFVAHGGDTLSDSKALQDSLPFCVQSQWG